MKLQARSYIDFKTLDTVLNGFDGALVVDETGRIVVYR